MFGLLSAQYIVAFAAIDPALLKPLAGDDADQPIAGMDNGKATKDKIQSDDLTDHIRALERLVSPVADQDSRLKELRDVMERRNLQAHATLFWHGPPGARHPAIPPSATEALRRLPADIEPDFANEDC